MQRKRHINTDEKIININRIDICKNKQYLLGDEYDLNNNIDNGNAVDIELNDNINDVDENVNKDINKDDDKDDDKDINEDDDKDDDKDINEDDDKDDNKEIDNIVIDNIFYDKFFNELCEKLDLNTIINKAGVMNKKVKKINIGWHKFLFECFKKDYDTIKKFSIDENNYNNLKKLKKIFDLEHEMKWSITYSIGYFISQKKINDYKNIINNCKNIDPNEVNDIKLKLNKEIELFNMYYIETNIYKPIYETYFNKCYA